jgi:hypothetical protein
MGGGEYKRPRNEGRIGNGGSERRKSEGMMGMKD